MEDRYKKLKEKIVKASISQDVIDESGKSERVITLMKSEYENFMIIEQLMNYKLLHDWVFLYVHYFQ